LGFIVYQLGIFMVEQPASLLGAAVKTSFAFFSLEQPVDLSASILKLAGGIIAILGLIVAVNGAAASGDRYVKALQALQASVRELESRIDGLQTSSLVQLHMQQYSCKFCGAKIEKDEFFCSTCGRAQK
jgi:hypothetical protein